MPRKKFFILIYAIIAILLVFTSCNSKESSNNNIKPQATIASPTQILNSTENNIPTPTAESTDSIIPTTLPSPTQTLEPTPAPDYYNADIIFSEPSGFYNQSFELVLTYNTDADIRFTLDGSEPTASSEKYATPIKITDKSNILGENDNMTVVRAAAFVKGKRVSKITTKTFLINGNHSSFNERYGKLAVISISTNKTNLYGSTGIFTNYTEHGGDSERPAHVEFFDTDGITAFSVDAGLRVYGGTSRGNPQKSLKLVARKEYDESNGKFKYAIFPEIKNKSGKVIDRYDSFILRAGGNDCLFGGTRQTFLRDALIHSLAVPISNIASQAYRPCVVYINGAYFGIYNIREDLDNDYIEQHYEIPKEEIAIIAYGHENGSWFYKIDEGTDKDLNNYKAMLSYIANNDMTNIENYRQAEKLLDFDNFIKYIGINVYSNNRDWPHNNVRAWCHEGKWRFMLKDIDYSWGIYHAPGNVINVVAEETGHWRNVLTGAEGGEISRAFASLMKNENFKNKFLKFMDKMINNYFSTQTVNNVVREMADIMAKEYDRYSTTYWYDNPDDILGAKHKISLTHEQWRSAINTLYEYGEKRPTVMENLLTELYG